MILSKSVLFYIQKYEIVKVALGISLGQVGIKRPRGLLGYFFYRILFWTYTLLLHWSGHFKDFLGSPKAHFSLLDVSTHPRLIMALLPPHFIILMNLNWLLIWLLCTTNYMGKESKCSAMGIKAFVLIPHSCLLIRRFKNHQSVLLQARFRSCLCNLTLNDH